MSRQRRRDTRPELELRRLLHAAGYRYRVDFQVGGLRRRTVDLAFTQAKVAVFVDGCFWHACPEHATWPRSNAEWWRDKLQANVERDRETDRWLRDLGWSVVRVWEHETPVEAAKGVATAVRRCA
jgi:DNA mismatch endonuclease, patch repair protein